MNFIHEVCRLTARWQSLLGAKGRAICARVLGSLIFHVGSARATRYLEGKCATLHCKRIWRLTSQRVIGSVNPTRLTGYKCSSSSFFFNRVILIVIRMLRERTSARIAWRVSGTRASGG